jgi:hypothetical protein
MPGVGLQMHLDTEGRVLHLTGPLRHVLAQQVPDARAPHLLDFAPALRPRRRRLSRRLAGPGPGPGLLHTQWSTLHLRGWVQPLADGWLLQLLDIGDLLLERRQSRVSEQCRLLAVQISEQLRLCSLTRLPEMLTDQLQGLAQRFHIPCIALALLDEQEQGWQIHQHFAGFDAPQLWHTDSGWAPASTA